ncbi:hypothetical protein 1 [Hubei tombus-like virus 9]|uniref:hypothetical protein 1 n=1 Tax=Hubei tombus-like virus 9 TaxID=1923296 RepID=UPI00090B062D|nr:hypothetical protein 1 [Hubei tombus-like virus 9]APG76490.1 hypothetical protein 1 [Hubei tombus-like virus 9]
MVSVQGYNSQPKFHPPGVRISDHATSSGREKNRHVLVDTGVPGVGLCYTHNNSADNLLRGLGERLLMVPTGDTFSQPPRPCADAFRCLEEYRRKVVSKCPKQTGPLERDEFVSLYDGPKRKRYEAAARNLADRELQKADWDINVFIKDETVCSWSKVDPAPRLISPRSPEYCLELGCYIKPVEKLLYKAVARVWGEVTIAKGLNFNQRGELIQQKWESFTEPVAVGLDASRFDQHVSTDALEFEHGFYTQLYPRSKKLPFLLSKQLLNEGRAYVDDKKIEYSVRGSRMSGDMNTALGNCLIMTSLVWGYLKERSVVGKLINDGDDCVVIMEKADLFRFMDGLTEWFTQRGFTMKVESPVYTLEEIEFCQCHPVFNGESYTMCRNVFKALFTDVAHVGRTWREVVGIRESISVAGAVWAKGIPVLSAFYRSLSTGAPQVVPRHSGTWWNAQGCNTGTVEITPASRESFAKAFHLDPAEQAAIEQMYDTLPQLPFSDPNRMLTYNPTIPADQYPILISEPLQVLLFNGP